MGQAYSMGKAYMVDVSETDVRKIIKHVKEMIPFAEKNGMTYLNLPDKSSIILYSDGTISCLYKPRRFVDGGIEKRRIIAKEVYDFLVSP